MKTIVISQPMFLPWIGLFEQIRLADVYVHYDDVLTPQGRSFMNRVQIKTPEGTPWLTAPVKHNRQTLIQNLEFDTKQNWRKTHLQTLHHAHANAPFYSEMRSLVENLYEKNPLSVADFNIAAIEAIADYFGLKPQFLRSSSLNTTTHSSQKLLDIVQQLGGDRYVTGHGAKNYLDHSLFEQHGIQVAYMHYQHSPYTQLHGEFTPYVTILDLIANMGTVGRDRIQSTSIEWRAFLHYDARH